MRNFLRKIFGEEKANASKEKTRKNFERTKQEKSIKKTQTPVESEYSIDEIIKGITFQTPNSNSYNTTNFELEDELIDKEVYEQIEIDKETGEKIDELKGITEEIDSKILTGHKLKPNVSFKINYEKELNAAQLVGVATTDIPLLVIAGAGSGKTRVITYKVSYLIECGIDPSEILLLTFTRKAANEMLERVQVLLGKKSLGGVLGGTFHSFSNYSLRKYGGLIGIPNNFTIIDTGDTADIISLLTSELNISAKKAGPPFPKKSKIQTIISKSKNFELSIDTIIRRHFNENIEYIQEIEILAVALASFKKASNLMDYDDLMIVLRDKLKENKVFRKKIQERIKYLLVDEYQDTNNIQREIVEFINGNRGSITVVGDDSQSIYAFRGANFENILRFPQTFPNCGVVKIEQNYRSEQGILNFANDIILNAKIGFIKKLYSTRYTGRKPTIKRFPDGTEEAEYIVDKILEIRENNLNYSDFSVLTRAGWHSNYIQTELTKRNIPYVVIGGIKFSERRHVKDIISFLKIVLNPLDAVAWHRILQLIEGIGKVKAREIVEVIHKNSGRIIFDNFSKRKYYHELNKLQLQFEQVIDQNLSPSQMVEGFLVFYKPILKQIEDDYEIRYKDLEVFSTIISKYEDLEKFLTDFTLEPPSNRYQDEITPIAETDEKPLIVSTIHSAKGLEWHTVFIPFALDGMIPSSRSLGTIQELEEERRLFYVASSRAKENLFVTMPSYVYSWDAVFTRPSRFLTEISRENYNIEK